MTTSSTLRSFYLIVMICEFHLSRTVFLCLPITNRHSTPKRRMTSRHGLGVESRILFLAVHAMLAHATQALALAFVHVAQHQLVNDGPFTSRARIKLPHITWTTMSLLPRIAVAFQQCSLPRQNISPFNNHFPTPQSPQPPTTVIRPHKPRATESPDFSS